MHQHLADAELARFALDPDSLTTSRRAAVELAMAECPTCRGSVDFFAVVGTDGEGWEDATAFGADDVMRSYVERLAAEDREADEIIEKEHLLASATKTAWRNLRRNKRVLTGGVVRKLNAHANSICESEPLDALTFAAAAISIAESLPDDHYPALAEIIPEVDSVIEQVDALLQRLAS